MKPLKVEMGELNNYLSGSHHKKRGDRSGAKTQEGFYKANNSNHSPDQHQDSILTSEYDNMNQYA